MDNAIKRYAAQPDGTGIADEGSMTVEAAVAFTGIARSNLYEAMRKGELPYSQPGRRRLIPKRALVDLLQKHMVGLPTQKS